MKTIAVFGASGRTGIPFVKKALEKGHKVKALVRDTSKFPIRHTNLQLLQGDILKQNNVEKTVSGADAVVTLIGHVKGSPEDLQQRSITYIIDAMMANGQKRLISLTGGGVRDEQHDTPAFMDKLIVFIMKNLAGKGTRHALMDGIAHAEIIRRSGLDWTIVRGPMLTDDAAKGNYQVGHVGKLKGFKLTREDLANFILKSVEENIHLQQMPFVVN